MTDQANKATPLDGIAAAIEGDTTLRLEGGDIGAAGAPQPEEPQALSNGQLLAAALGMGTGVFCSVTHLQSPRRILTEQRCAELGELWGPVLDKYGINAGQFMGAWALEITAVVGTVGIAMELRAAVRAEIAQVEAEAEKKAEPEGVPSAVPA